MNKEELKLKLTTVKKLRELGLLKPDCTEFVITTPEGIQHNLGTVVEQILNDYLGEDGMGEQKLEVTTTIKFDKWDALKLLFGRCAKVTQTVWLAQKLEVHSYNASAKIEIEKTSTHFVKQDKPRYGYVAKEVGDE